MILRIATYTSALALTILISGCDNSPEPPLTPVMVGGHDDHGHEHGGEGHPETLGEALHQLTELRDTVRDAFAANDSEAAHGPLHSVHYLMGEVSEMAGEAEISDEAKATIDSNIDVLKDSFGAVDKKMHSEDEGSDYSEVSEKIDAAMAAIVEAAGAAGEHDEHGDHAHAEGHHDDDGDGHEEGEHEGHDDDHDHKEGHDDHDHDDHKKE